MPCVRIRDRDGDFLSFDLRDVLKNLESVGAAFQWYILNLEGQSFGNSGLSIKALEREISKSRNGTLVTWPQLTELASKLSQTSDCVIVGIAVGTEPPSLPIEEQYRGDKVIIAAFDSSYWTVCVPRPEIARHLQSAFRDTEIVERIDVA
jgi:hypothetical protein